MNNIKIFNNPEFGKIRTVQINGEPWFVGKDVAAALGYARPDNAVTEKVDEDDRFYIDAKSHPEIKDEINYRELGQRGGWVVNESGLYSLIFNSKLPSAKKFKHWVTSEVLPTIRRTGGYGQAQMPQSSMELLELHYKALKEVDVKVNALSDDLHTVQKDFEDFKNDMPILGIEEAKIINAVKKKGVECLGGMASNAYGDKSLRGRLYSDLHKQLRREFAISSYRAIRRNQVDAAVAVIQNYTPPLVLAETIDTVNAQQRLSRAE